MNTHENIARFSALIGEVLSVSEPPQGMQSQVKRLVTERGNFIAKTPHDPQDTEEESHILAALAALESPLVPRFIGRIENTFVFTEVDGTNLAVRFATESFSGRLRICKAFGRALREVHSWKPPIAPKHDDWLGWICAEAKLPRPEGFTDLVFGHGDWCLPNVLMDDQGTVTGLVDWSWGGYIDRRFDLGTGLWTIGYNLELTPPDKAPNENHGTHRRRLGEAFLAGYGGAEWVEKYDTLAFYTSLYAAG
jgi:aminoglycoside phosphotransferase (APT) family kinase protein